MNVIKYSTAPVLSYYICIPSQHTCLRYNYRATFRNNWPRASIPLIHGSRGLHPYQYTAHSHWGPLRTSSGVCFSYVGFFKQTSSCISWAGFNGNEALRYRVLMGMKPALSCINSIEALDTLNLDKMYTKPAWTVRDCNTPIFYCKNLLDI